MVGFFAVLGWFFIVPGQFSWFFMVPGWYFMVPGRFSWFHVGFHGFSWFHVGFLWFQVGFHCLSWFHVGYSWFSMVPGWFFMVFSLKCARPNCILARQSNLGPPPGGRHRT